MDIHICGGTFVSSVLPRMYDTCVHMLYSGATMNRNTVHHDRIAAAGTNPLVSSRLRTRQAQATPEQCAYLPWSTRKGEEDDADICGTMHVAPCRSGGM